MFGSCEHTRHIHTLRLCSLNTVHHTLDDSTLIHTVHTQGCFSLNSLLSPDRFTILVDGHDHTGAHGRGEGVDEVVEFPQERIFQVEGEVQCGEDAGHGGRNHEEAVTVVGGHCDQTFPGVEPSLGEAHTEERVTGGGQAWGDGKRHGHTGRGGEGKGKGGEEERRGEKRGKEERRWEKKRDERFRLELKHAPALPHDPLLTQQQPHCHLNIQHTETKTLTWNVNVNLYVNVITYLSLP